jgi:hypothetical protein
MLNSNSPRNSVQPPCNRRSAKPAGLTSEHDESRLARVLGRMVIAKDGVADALNECGVPPHEQLERGFVTLIRKPSQQHVVALACIRSKHGLEVTDHAARVRVGHLARSVGSCLEVKAPGYSGAYAFLFFYLRSRHEPASSTPRLAIENRSATVGV